MTNRYTLAMNLLDIHDYSFTILDLKKAYFKKAITCHPDKNKNSPESTKMFQDIKDSYDLLTDICIHSNTSNIHNDDDDIFIDLANMNIKPDEYLDTIIHIGTSMFVENIIQWNGVGKFIVLLMVLYNEATPTYDSTTYSMIQKIYILNRARNSACRQFRLQSGYKGANAPLRLHQNAYII